MLILRLRQSEVALADGRLDEAYQLAAAQDLSSHRRGQRVINRLVCAFVKRGNDHLQAGRFAEALADGEKAAKLGGNQPAAAALRAAAVDGLTTRQRVENRQQRIVAEARRLVDNGRLDLGEQWLNDSPTDVSRVQIMRREIDQRKSLAVAAIRKAKDALARSELTAAAGAIEQALAVDPHDSELADLSHQVCDALRKQARSALDDGRLHRADQLLDCLQRLDPQGIESRELDMSLRQLRQAWAAIENGNLGEARVIVARAAANLPSAKWLRQVADQLEQADGAITQLRTGSLAWLAGAPTMANVEGKPPVVGPRVAAHVAPHVTPRSPSALPSRFLIHVDAVGAFLVLRQPIVTIGPVSAAVAADVPVVVEPTAPAIHIERVEDDYFLKTVNVKIGSKLLATGDKLELSPRCRLTFALPNPASTTAVLDLAGARMPRADIRRVILMDHDLIIGSGSTSHIRVDALAEPILLHLRDGQLLGQGKQPIVLGEQVKIGDLSFVVTDASRSTIA